MQRHMAGALRAAHLSKLVLLACAALMVLVGIAPAEAARGGHKKPHAGHAKHQKTARARHGKRKNARPARHSRDWSAPSAPHLDAAAGNQKVDLAWSASSDNIGVKGYRIYRNTTLVGTVSATTLTYTDAPLANGVSNLYFVKSYDRAGNLSPTSNQVTATPSAGTTDPGPTPPPPPPPPPPSGVDPSGESMPAGDIPGWHQIFADDFAQNVPLGSFPSQVAGKWGAYPYPWSGTPSWATYYPEKTTSVANGMMDIWLHSENINGSTKYLISAPVPRINGAGNDENQLYGRYAIRFKTDQFPQYHASWLLWPKSEQWPRDGEIDFPEADFNSNISAFMHRQNGTSGGDQDGYSTSTPIYGGWHTAVIEWLPSRLTFILDGRVIGQSTSRIPNTPMHYVIQNGGSFGVTNPNPTVQGHVYIDWVSVYRPA